MDGNGEHDRGLAERLTGGAEDRLGRAFSDLLESPLLSGALGRAFDAREKAAQAQELAMGALNLPSAADVERLTRRLRSVSQRIEGIEDGIARLERNVTARLTTLEAELKATRDAAERAAERADAAAAGGGANARASAGSRSSRASSRSGSRASRSSSAGTAPSSARKGSAAARGAAISRSAAARSKGTRKSG